MAAFMLLFLFSLLALPFLMIWYAWKQYLAIRTLRGGWWKVLAWLPIAFVGYLLVFFVIPGMTAPVGNLGPIPYVLAALVADFAFVGALLWLYLLLMPITYEAGAAAPVRGGKTGLLKAVAWAVGFAVFVFLGLSLGQRLIPVSGQGFALLLALLFLSLLSIAYRASRRDQNIPPEDRHMHRAAEIGEAVAAAPVRRGKTGLRKAVAWAVGVAEFVVVALIIFTDILFWPPGLISGWLWPLLFLCLLSIAYGASRRDQNIPPEDHMHRAAEIGKAAARVVGVVAFVVLVVLVLIIKVPGWLDPSIQRDSDDCNQSGDLDRRIDACTRNIGRGGGSARCPVWARWCSRSNLFAAHYDRGAAYADKGDHDRAIADYKEAIGLYPKAAYADYNRGLAYTRKGDYERAIAEFDEAIRLDPNNALLRNALLILHSFTGAPDDGAGPQGGLIFDGNGALYGRAITVFKLTPPAAGQTQWTQTVLCRCGGTKTGLIFDGNGALYGTTNGGESSYTGTVFKLTPPAAGQTQWTETVLHGFTGGFGQPSLPPSHINPNDLIFDGNGALYGTTYFGGSSNTGMVFKLTPPAAGETQWAETVLHSFTGGTDGLYPEGGLIFDGNGALYGTTTSGGGEKNRGTVFKLTPPAAGQTQWTETVLYSFAGETDGGGPNGSLIFDRNGALYGTTMSGRRASLLDYLFSFDLGGTVFKLTPPAAGQTQWTHTVLHIGTDDRRVRAGVIIDGDGALYGTTKGGGSGDDGTVYKLTPPPAGQTQWTETVLHSFTGGTDGGSPSGSLIFDGNGALYGTTARGGQGYGTVFKLTGTKH